MARVIAVAGLSVVHDVSTMRYDDQAVSGGRVQGTYYCQQLQTRMLACSKPTRSGYECVRLAARTL